MYCSNCGKKLGDEDRFCDSCGTPVYEEASGDPESRETVREAVSDPEEKPELDEENTVVLEKVPEPAASGERDGDSSGQEPGEGPALSDLEKKIMKNMEDELILEMPEAAGPASYGNGQVPPSFAQDGREQAGAGVQPPYGRFPYEQSSFEQPPCGQEAGGKPSKKKKALIITLSCIAVALAAAVAVLVFLLLSPENKLKQCVEDRDWPAACALYEERFRDNEKKQEKADEILRDAVDALKEEFAAGTMDYSTVKRHLKGIEDFWDDPHVEDALEFVRELGDSREAFEEAEQCMGQEEYEDAIRLYGEVAESDANYQAAMEKLETAKTKYKEKLLAEAEAYTEVKDYDSAIALVEEGLEVLAGDAALNSRLEELLAEQKQHGIDAVLKEAADRASQNNYYEALETVRKGLQENAGNDKLETALKDYSEKYKQDILARAEAAIGTDENYEAAILVFDSALNTLNGDYAQIEQAIREKREEYVQLQLDKSQRENMESAIVGVWHGVLVSTGGMDISMDQFLELSGMPGAAMMIDCQPSGSLHLDMVGQVGNGTWRRDEAGSGVYYLDVEGDVQPVQIDTSGKLHMSMNGVELVFEKTGGA